MSASEVHGELPELPDLFAEEDRGSTDIGDSYREVGPGMWRGGSSRRYLLGVSGAMCVALIVAGYVLPWITINRGSFGGHSFGPLWLPVVNAIGVMWTCALLAIAIVGVMSSKRVVLAVGLGCSLVTTAVLIVVLFVLQLIPRIIPFWVLPKKIRGYVPDISVGSGVPVAVVASVLLLAWFVFATFSTPSSR
jgi:hypothetical protein